MLRLVITYPQVQLFFVGLLSFMLRLSKYLFSEIRMPTNIIPITLQLALIGFFPTGNPFIIKDAG